MILQLKLLRQLVYNAKKISGIVLNNFNWKKILLKISGESLMGDDSFGINPSVVKSFANQIDIPDDEFYLCPPFFVDFLKKEKGIYPDGVCKLDDESTFLTITLGVDESYFSDDNGGRLFQGSGTLICLKVSDDFIYKNEELTFYQFSSDFDCHYYKDYGIIKLGEFHVYESE